MELEVDSAKISLGIENQKHSPNQTLQILRPRKPIEEHYATLFSMLSHFIQMYISIAHVHIMSI